MKYKKLIINSMADLSVITMPDIIVNMWNENDEWLCVQLLNGTIYKIKERKNMRVRLPFTKPSMRKKDMIETIRRLETKIDGLETLFTQIKKPEVTMKHLQCDVKGHRFVFNKVENRYGWYFLNPEYQFKCSNCGLTITKTETELTVKEKNALKTLGVLK